LSTIKLVVVALVAGLLLAPPAQASEQRTRFGDSTSSASVTASTTVVKIDAGSCGTPVRYSVVPGPLPDGGSYDVFATLRNQNDKSFGSDRTWMEEGTAYRGSIYPRCGKELASGTYTISVKVVVNDYYLSPVETRVGTAKVRLAVTRPAPTMLVVRKSPYGTAGWQWTGRLTSQGRPVANQRIDLWWDLLGWDDYEVSKRTNGNGIAHWVSNPNGAMGGINFRLKFPGSKSYAPSQSTVFNIAPR
jgi:hypothetical protein